MAFSIAIEFKQSEETITQLAPVTSFPWVSVIYNLTVTVFHFQNCCAHAQKQLKLTTTWKKLPKHCLHVKGKKCR